MRDSTGPAARASGGLVAAGAHLRRGACQHWAVALLPPLTDTIVAIASAPGVGAVGVVRLSGPSAYAIADSIFVPRRGGKPSSRPAGRVIYGDVVAQPSGADQQSGAAGKTIDEALMLTFRAPRSYTAQDVVELQTHGGAAVLREALDLCVAHGARLAQPGEFTLRAFLNGRIDLLQAESVLDMVNAQSDGARRNAALGLSGALTTKLNAVQSHLTGAYAAVQASFDYPDEGVPEAQLGAPLEAAAHEIAALLSTASAGRLSRQGARLALLGRPNAGKSSLLNALLGYQRSIVSDTPGTTRDYLEAPLVIGGVHVTAIDTAGIREAADAVEASGVEQARHIGRHADVRLVVLDGSEPLTADDHELLRAVQDGRTVVVVNKRDKPAAFDAGELGLAEGVAVLELSALTGAGLQELERVITDALLGDAATTELWITHERHVAALEAANEHVSAARLQAEAGDLDLVALELQDALTALAAMTGRHDVAEETLASIFASFCVGK